MARQRIDGRSRELDALVALDGTQAVQRNAIAIDDTTQKAWTHSDAAGPLTRHHARGGRQPMHVAGGHQVELVAGEADDFRFGLAAITVEQIADVAHRGLATGGLERETHHARERAFDRWRRQRGGARHLALHALAPAQRTFGAELPDGVGAGHFSSSPIPGSRSARSSPRSPESVAATAVSKRASMLELSLLTRQPPRAISGSSESCHC
jgi:hypothetical protein